MDLTLGGAPRPGSPTPGTNSGALRPQTLQRARNDPPVVFTGITGAVEFAGPDGRLRGLHVVATEWSAMADGSWIGVPGGSTAFQSTLALQSIGMPKDLLAVLPEDLITVFDDLKFSAAGPFEL